GKGAQPGWPVPTAGPGLPASAKDPLRSCRETDNAAAPPPRSSVRNHQGTRAARCDRYCGCDGSVPAATARRSRTCNQVLVQVTPTEPLLETSYSAGMGKVHPDEKRPPHDVFICHKAPVTAVQTVVAVVSHHEVMPFGNLAAHAGAAVIAVIPQEGIVGNGNQTLRGTPVEQDVMSGSTQLFIKLGNVIATVGLEEVAHASLFDRLIVDGQLLVM